jgi:ubiquinone/menaquinone biosynthesis C-methylase UbiE
MKKITTDGKVKKFWEEQAETFKESELATAPDHYYRDLEMRSILTHLKDGASILDVGCGNGFSTFHFARSLPKATFQGVDFSEQMVVFAQSACIKESKKVQSRVSFSTGNVLSLSTTAALKGKKFDYIVSERCLINLADWNEQQQALLEMKKLLKKGGRIILTENTQEGLARLNVLRKNFDLSAINVRWHNFYMPEKKLIAYAKKVFTLESVENIGNLYYIISRVVYAKLAQLEGREPEYMNPINEIASRLPTLSDHHYSPNFIFVLKNK